MVCLVLGVLEPFALEGVIPAHHYVSALYWDGMSSDSHLWHAAYIRNASTLVYVITLYGIFTKFMSSNNSIRWWRFWACSRNTFETASQPQFIRVL
jgi:hypothetical protein